MTHSGWKAWSKVASDEQGSVLATVLVVLSLLLIIFIAVSAYTIGRYSYHVKERNRTVAAYLAESGIHRARSQFESLQPEGSVTEWGAPNGGFVSTEMSAWGPYVLAVSKGTYANQEVLCTALLGSAHDTLLEAAVRVGDERYPLVVAGNSLIAGDVVTGPLGMQTGRIRGEAPVEEDFHSGSVYRQGSVSVPQVDGGILDAYLQQQAQRRLGVSVMLPSSQVWKPEAPAKLEAGEATQIQGNLLVEDAQLRRCDLLTSVFVDGQVEISGRTVMSGLVEIVAAGPIIIHDSVVLDEVLLFSSDSIVIGGNAVFSGVALIGTAVRVRDQAVLKHSACIMLYTDEDQSESTHELQLSSSAPMAGVCYVASAHATSDTASRTLVLDTGSQFTGYLLSEDYAEVHGFLKGMVSTEQFRYSSPPTTYVNWVRDFKVYRQGLDYYPAVPVMAGLDRTNTLRIVRMDREAQ